ncbi:hypothetical protein [Pseudemcibacter aquimaris]|uniref:hypothetical protein n=1 Tax=Pseudemcibacter aquimaris TaxID=2857064 RepID=UPI0020130091|nr:hypothetical protein [Pseudemcibacter aquimaris]MCC3861753.1 hypothetical protein [Pseudemcibacter aquimaris]WDU58522.1 hypothetical protein KW060_15125 [Pseudemcibacter aquimaris]
MISRFSQLSTKMLGVIFTCLLLLFTVINLPASFLGSKLQASGVDYMNQSGDFWNASFDNLIIAGHTWQKLDVKPRFSGVMVGDFAADFDLYSHDQRLTGNVKVKDDILEINNISASAAINVKGFSQPEHKSLIHMTSEKLIFNENGQCQSGDFNLKSNLLTVLLGDLGQNLPDLTGNGICQNGLVQFTMQASDNGFDVNYRGEVSKNGQSGLLSFTLPPEMASNDQLMNMLQSSGFEKSGNQWRLNMEFSL